MTGRTTLSEPVIIDRWWKGRRRNEAIQVSLKIWEGHHLLDVRVWFVDDAGILRPGKGMNCNVCHLPRLATAIGKAFDRARELGLLADGAADGKDGA
jgi:hypothetical protein